MAAVHESVGVTVDWPGRKDLFFHCPPFFASLVLNSQLFFNYRDWISMVKSNPFLSVKTGRSNGGENPVKHEFHKNGIIS